MLTRLLIAGSFIAAGTLASVAQTSPPPSPAPLVAPVITDATHCRDTNGMVRLKVGATGAPNTTGSASNTVPSSNPGTSSSVNSPSNMPGSNQAEANLSPC
jgi:hypothetical protein